MSAAEKRKARPSLTFFQSVSQVVSPGARKKLRRFRWSCYLVSESNGFSNGQWAGHVGLGCRDFAVDVSFFELGKDPGALFMQGRSLL